jgi:hypothetical protein
MIIQIKVKDIIKYRKEDIFGLNPYCLNEGADGEDYIECELTNYQNEIMNNIKENK